MEAYFIEACTGCSCCSNENFFTGPYLTEEEAREVAESLHRCRRLASQYAEAGIYTIYRYEGAEQLPDGRIICGHRIFPARPDEEECPCYCPEEFRDQEFEYDDNLILVGSIGGQTHEWGGQRIG